MVCGWHRETVAYDLLVFGLLQDGFREVDDYLLNCCIRYIQLQEKFVSSLRPSYLHQLTEGLRYRLFGGILSQPVEPKHRSTSAEFAM